MRKIPKADTAGILPAGFTRAVNCASVSPVFVISGMSPQGRRVSVPGFHKYAGGGSMNILMMTGTVTPFVGGVSRAVTAFARECRNAGHRLVIVAPTFERVPDSEEGIIRIPAIQHFNGSSFSVALPISGDSFVRSRRRWTPSAIHGKPLKCR